MSLSVLVAFAGGEDFVSAAKRSPLESNSWLADPHAVGYLDGRQSGALDADVFGACSVSSESHSPDVGVAGLTCRGGNGPGRQFVTLAHDEGQWKLSASVFTGGQPEFPNTPVPSRGALIDAVRTYLALASEPHPDKTRAEALFAKDLRVVRLNGGDASLVEGLSTWAASQRRTRLGSIVSTSFEDVRIDGPLGMAMTRVEYQQGVRTDAYLLVADQGAWKITSVTSAAH